jgi:hypothetical protein
MQLTYNASKQKIGGNCPTLSPTTKGPPRFLPLKSVISGKKSSSENQKPDWYRYAAKELNNQYGAN